MSSAPRRIRVYTQVATAIILDVDATLTPETANARGFTVCLWTGQGVPFALRVWGSYGSIGRALKANGTPERPY